MLLGNRDGRSREMTSEGSGNSSLFSRSEKMQTQALFCLSWLRYGDLATYAGDGHARATSG